MKLDALYQIVEHNVPLLLFESLEERKRLCVADFLISFSSGQERKGVLFLPKLAS